jgi:hypothetical protein
MSKEMVNTKRLTVDSDKIKSAGYDIATRTLEIYSSQ